MKRISIIFWVASLAIIAIVVGVLPARGATLSVQIPDGCTPILAGFTVTCAGVTPPGPPVPPPVPPPLPPPSPGGGFAACAAAGYTVQTVEMQYPLGTGQLVDTGNGGPRFGNTDALVVHFRTPAADPSGSAQFSLTARGMAPNVFRVAALAVAPCVFPLGFSTALPAATRSQGPAFHVTLNPSPPNASFVVLRPNTDYYITVTNRNDFAGSASCTTADCQVFIQAN